MIETITELATAGCIYGIMVFFKAFQQRNVAHLHYYAAVPTSYALTFSDVYVITIVSINAVKTSGDFVAMATLAFALGTGGWIGSLVAMRIHELFVTRKKDDD